MNVAHNLKRFKNISRWIAGGDFRRLLRAVLDQVKIKSAGPRRFIYRYSVFDQLLQRRLLRRLLKEYYDVDELSPDANFKVALILRDGTTYPKSSAFIRLISPLTHESLKGKLSIELYGENTVDIAPDTKVCIVQRTAYDSEKTASKFIQNVHKLHAALIVDSDDAFHDIDETHPEHSEQVERIKALNHITRAADQIWLSVPALAASYSADKDKAVIVANSLDARVFKPNRKKPAAPKHGPIQMVYMGTATHDADFKLILPALDKLAAQNPGSFKLTVIGVGDELPDRPWAERLYQPNRGSIYPLFFNWFLKQGPFDIGLSPLVDSEFNRGKSDIKCLDYLGAGIRPVVSDVQPYQTAELQKFVIKSSDGDWLKTLATIVEDPDKFRADNAQILPAAQTYIWQKRSSKNTAAQIFQLLKRFK